MKWCLGAICQRMPASFLPFDMGDVGPSLRVSSGDHGLCKTFVRTQVLFSGAISPVAFVLYDYARGWPRYTQLAQAALWYLPLSCLAKLSGKGSSL